MGRDGLFSTANSSVAAQFSPAVPTAQAVLRKALPEQVPRQEQINHLGVRRAHGYNPARKPKPTTTPPHPHPPAAECRAGAA